MKKEKRFVKVFSEDSFSTAYEVIVDKETGVNYLVYKTGYAGGITPLLDREGKPVISTISNEL